LVRLVLAVSQVRVLARTAQHHLSFVPPMAAVAVVVLVAQVKLAVAAAVLLARVARVLALAVKETTVVARQFRVAAAAQAAQAAMVLV
jgi:hypothetical protein